MKAAALKFDADLWRWRCLYDFVSYQTLSDLIGNSSAIDAHLKTRPVITATGEAPTAEILQMLLDSERNTIEGLVDHFASQTIVSVCTSFEVAIKEFLSVWFFHHPQHIHEYLATNQTKGVVPLKGIIDATDRDELLQRLAAKAADVATNGIYSKVLGRVEKHSKIAAPSGLAEDMSALREIRNRIVHEKEQESGRSIAVSKAQHAVDEAILYLARVGDVSKLPGMYSRLPRG